jgi:hypothetical protein
MKSGVVHGVVHTDSLYTCLIIENNNQFDCSLELF